MKLLNLHSFVLILLISLDVSSTVGDNNIENHKHDQARIDMLKDFRPSRLISETRMEAEDAVIGGNTNSNGRNHAVSQRSPANPLLLEIEQKTESSVIQGRVFGGGAFGNGWSSGGHSGSWGGGGNQCQNLHSYNSGCCNLGYKNCCHGGGGHGVGIGGGIQFPPLRHPPGNSWGSPLKGKGQPQYQNQHFHHQRHRPPVQHQHFQHQHHHQPVQHQHFHQPRPHIQPFPIAGNFQKPGSCYYKPSFSFLNKFSNLFTKGKVFDHSHHHQSTKGKGGWGWNPYPPSQNAGYYFHRRSDSALSKRQLDLSPDDNHFRQFEEDYFKYDNRVRNPNTDVIGNRDHHGGSDDRQEKKFEASYPSQSYGHVPPNVGIGSLTGRIFGGLGWNSGITTGWTVTDPNIPCYVDYECSGIRKCCDGTCKTPSFSK